MPLDLITWVLGKFLLFLWIYFLSFDMFKFLLNLITWIFAVSILSWSSYKLLHSSVFFLLVLYHLCFIKDWFFLNLSYLINPAVNVLNNVWFFPNCIFQCKHLVLFFKMVCVSFISFLLKYICTLFSLSYLCFFQTVLWVWKCSPPDICLVHYLASWFALWLSQLFPELLWGFFFFF